MLSVVEEEQQAAAHEYDCNAAINMKTGNALQGRNKETGYGCYEQNDE